MQIKESLILSWPVDTSLKTEWQKDGGRKGHPGYTQFLVQPLLKPLLNVRKGDKDDFAYLFIQ